MKNFKVSPLARQFALTFGFFGSCGREYFEVLLQLSLRYGADLGRSRLVYFSSVYTLIEKNNKYHFPNNTKSPLLGKTAALNEIKKIRPAGREHSTNYITWRSKSVESKLAWRLSDSFI